MIRTFLWNTHCPLPVLVFFIVPSEVPFVVPKMHSCSSSRLLLHGSWSVVSLMWGRDSLINFLIHRPQPRAVKSWIGAMRYINREKTKTPATPAVCRPQNTLSVHWKSVSILKCLFVCFWLHWVFVAACWLFLVGMSWGHPSLGYASFSLQWLRLLWSPGSRA